MAGRVPIGANITDRDAVVPTVLWPGLARPPTILPVSAPQVVDGRHKAGHDTVGTATPQAAILTPMGPSPGMTTGQRLRVSTYPRFVVAPMRTSRAMTVGAPTRDGQ